MNNRKKIGDMLKESGVINDFQLETALSHQKSWGGKLGIILIELKFAQEEDIARVISAKLRIPYINLFDPEIPDDVIKLIDPNVAKKYGVIPAKKEGRTLHLAMSDPLDMDAIDTIRFITGLNIKPLLAMTSEIEDAICQYYHKEKVLRTKGQRCFIPRGSSVDSGKMEIIWGSDLNTSTADSYDTVPDTMLKEDYTLKRLTSDLIRMDAVITLLIKKGVITREEVASIVHVKKKKLK